MPAAPVATERPIDLFKAIFDTNDESDEDESDADEPRGDDDAQLQPEAATRAQADKAEPAAGSTKPSFLQNLREAALQQQQQQAAGPGDLAAARGDSAARQQGDVAAVRRFEGNGVSAVGEVGIGWVL